MRAARAHDQLRRRAGTEPARPALRVGRLRRARDHGSLGANRRRLDRAATGDLGRGAERAGRRPGTRRARARDRYRGRPRAAGRRLCAARGCGRLDRGERRCPLPGAHLLERLADGPVRGLRGPRRDRGLQRRLRPRDRPRRGGPAVGRGARARPSPVRDRLRRLAPSRLRQRLRLGLGALCRADAGSRPGRASQRLLLQLGGAGDPLGRAGRRCRHGALQPGRECDARRRAAPRIARERRAARLPARSRDPRARLERSDHGRPA